MGQFERVDPHVPWLSRLLPCAVESAWTTSRWDKLRDYLQLSEGSGADEFNMKIGTVLLSLHQQSYGMPGEHLASREEIHAAFENLRLDLGKSLTSTSTSSLQACRDTMLKLHVLHDLEAIINIENEQDRGRVLSCINRRLDVLGGYPSDKQYILGVTRAAIQLW